ncbi:hypothetical protein Goarm_012734 [Gossypium armourianum]|uniref:CCHC-type domain-containing protein n=1 Tax=Gossypium armourianum TaxID=34283 RepID=A0A7J9J123_9ROSI|nr:hypothetical protein [Gossypium armourianum]
MSGLSKGLYTKSLLKFIKNVIDPIVKIDHNTYNNSRGQFARLAVYIDLGKSLVSKVKIDGKIHMEYESMPLVCFDCGRFRHTRDTCPYRSRQRETANGNLGRETLAQEKVDEE